MEHKVPRKVQVDPDRKVVVGMAKNYTPKELFEVIVDGTDVDAISDVSRRYSVLTVTLAKLVPQADLVRPVLASLPDYLSARKLEKYFHKGASEDDVTEGEPDAAEPESEPEAEEEKPAPKKRGRKPKAATVVEEDKPESDAGKYDGIPAPKLFQECKKRGIKAAPKKPAEFYIKLLEEADNASTDDAEDDGDDWDI